MSKDGIVFIIIQSEGQPLELCLLAHKVRDSLSPIGHGEVCQWKKKGVWCLLSGGEGIGSEETAEALVDCMYI